MYNKNFTGIKMKNLNKIYNLDFVLYQKGYSCDNSYIGFCAEEKNKFNYKDFKNSLVIIFFTYILNIDNFTLLPHTKGYNL